MLGPSRLELANRPEDVVEHPLELGQPLHAYDASLLQGPIRPRLARTGEKVALLDESEVELKEDTLIITGRVPSYYLKQLLQEALRQVDGVNRIENRVDVISCDGLSSPPRH